MQTQQPNYTILTMNLKEVQDIAIHWAKEEGWNPGLEDATAFYAQDSQGFFAGCLDDKPIGCCSSVIYDENFAFFGFYIVKAEYRYKGYGIQMTRHRLKYVGNRNIGLDGVLPMIDKYMNIGFRPAYMNIRYQGQVALQEKRDPHVMVISEPLIPEIERYDRLYFPAPRKIFLKEWLKVSPDRLALVYLVEGVVKGYGVIRRCFAGYKIGPLFAESFDIANQLFQSLSVQAKGETIFLDIPEPNLAAIKLVDRYKMEQCFKTLRMYTKETPDNNLDHIYGVTTFELG